MPTYPIARYRFVFEVQTGMRLPDFAGSMLRGAFGNALRRTACMTREKDCKGCPLYRTCPYTAIFETPAPDSHGLQKFSQIPNPYVIEPPAWGGRLYQPGEKLEFHMVLTGAAINQLALIVFAWQRAFRHEVGHGTAEMVDVLYCGENGDESVWDGQRLQSHAAGLQLAEMAPGPVFLQIKTPLRLQDNGKPLRPDSLTARDLLVAAMRRISLMLEFHAGLPPQHDFHERAAEAATVMGRHDLQWLDWTRYSSRQKQEMQLGGVVGTWQLDHVPSDFRTWLQLGQWLHLGKNATFGLGHYQIAA